MVLSAVPFLVLRGGEKECSKKNWMKTWVVHRQGIELEVLSSIDVVLTLSYR